jgi:hypothetical protein
MMELPNAKIRALLMTYPLHYVRPLLFLVALQMLLISGGILRTYVKLSSIQNADDSILLGVSFPLWIVLLSYGGICGLYGFFSNSAFAVKQTLACWTGVSILHLWFLLYILPEVNTNDLQITTIAFQFFTDVVIIGFLCAFLIILQAHQVQETLQVKDKEIQPLLHHTTGYIASMNDPLRSQYYSV